jgi:two-component system, LuxR family, response regulator FixJ
MNRQPTVFLVDPDGLTRDAVKKLTNQMDLRCEAFGSGQEFLDALDPDQPGCVVLEIKVPGINGLQIQQRLREAGVMFPVIFISAGPSVSIAVHAMRAGALHFLEKPVRENDLWNAVQEAVQLDQRRRQAQLQQQEVEERVGTLTEKEQAVLEMIAEGLAKHSIAIELGVSVRTIEHHRTQLMRKLQTSSLTGLMQFALSRKNGHSPTDGTSSVRLTGSNR